MTNLFDSHALPERLTQAARKGDSGGYIINASKGTSWGTVYALAERACISGNKSITNPSSRALLNYTLDFAALKLAMSEFDGIQDDDILDRLCLSLMKGAWANLMGAPLIKPAVRLTPAEGRRKPWDFKKARESND